MNPTPQPGRADRRLVGLVAACLLAARPAVAEPRACADPATVAAVLRLLSDKIGLAGPLALDHIRSVPADPTTEGGVCEADVAGIRNGPTMFGRNLDRVQYWGGLPPDGAATPAVDARLMPGAAEVPPAPALVDAARPAP